MRGNVLQAEGIAAFRGERLVFRDLSFSVTAGGALLLIGPNGSGKSTLLRVLAGLLRPEVGRVSWNGDDALADLTEHARRVVYAGHLDAVKPGLTVAENLAFSASVARGQSTNLFLRPHSSFPRKACPREASPHVRPSIPDALAALGLADLADLPARMLSAGQRRRLALARIALSPAPLWLLDEPTLGLDADSLDLAGQVFARHRAGGGIIVAATHVGLPLPGAAELPLG